MALGRTKSDGFVRGWHPDQRAGLPGRPTGKKCAHPAQDRAQIHNSNGDLVMWCARCDQTWEEIAT